MDDYSYSQALEQRAVARRAAQANGQALSEKVAELASARPVADAAHAYAAAYLAGEPSIEVLDLRWKVIEAHEATTPSQAPSSHVIVERAELERLREDEKALDDAAGELNEISTWLMRNGTSARRPDGTWDYLSAILDVVRAKAGA